MGPPLTLSIPDAPSSPTTNVGRLSSSGDRILRSSFGLSPSWDKEREQSQALEGVDNSETFNVAFFPALPTFLAGNQPETVNGDVKLSKTKKTFPQTESDDNWSTASISDDSLYSDNFDADDVWQDVPAAAPDAILGIAASFRSCENPKKVNVCVGAYRDDNGKPYVLPTVRKAEYMLLDQNDTKEYLPIEGDKDFISCAMKFAYGDQTSDFLSNHIAAVQTLSGTGACSIGGRFLAQFWPDRSIYVPNPTWGNHIAIFQNCRLKVRKYRYYDRSTNKLDLEGIIEDLQRAREGSIILFHACAHNPTGCDPTMEEWKEIISLVSNKKHIAFFDSAYQGFASGNAEEDAQAFRYAVSQRVPILLAQSFAKNFGLYGER